MSNDDAAAAVPPVGEPTSIPTGAAPEAFAGPQSDPPAAEPTGPPWSLDVVADLHAGRYPDDIAGPLRERLAADPWAASALAALDMTVDELSLLPAPRMPERFALRLDAAIAAEVRSAAAGRSTTGNAAAGAAVEPAVPPPRQAFDQSLSTSRVAGPPAAGGRSAPWYPAPPQSTPPRSAPPQSGVQQPGPPVAGYPGVPAGLRAVPPSGSLPSAPPAAVPPPAPRSTSDHIASGGSATGVPGVATSRPFAGSAGSSVPGLPPVRSLDAARAGRRRWIGGLAAAAAVVAIGSATVASLQHGRTNDAAAPAPVAGSSGSGGSGSALELDPGRFGDALNQIEGKRPAGPLQDTATYNSCVAANAINPSAVRGVTSVTFQGRAAAAFAVVVDSGHTRIVVVGSNCGIGGAADQLASQTVDR